MTRCRSTRAAKIMFLVEHPELLDATGTEIANALKAAGLVSPKTNPVDLFPRRLREETREVLRSKTVPAAAPAAASPESPAS